MTSHYWYEAGVLSMWDVIAEKFGFMLVWGDLVLVPFFYCIGGWWLISETEAMSAPMVGALAGLHVLGLWIFRGSNAQKDQFKRHPDRPIWGKAPETIGGRLLVSGWWGIGRKINYTGEIMVYFSFALCTGFSVGGAVPTSAVAVCVVAPSGLARREALPRQVWRAVGAVH